MRGPRAKKPSTPPGGDLWPQIPPPPRSPNITIDITRQLREAATSDFSLDINFDGFPHSSSCHRTHNRKHGRRQESCRDRFVYTLFESSSRPHATCIRACVCSPMALRRTCQERSERYPFMWRLLGMYHRNRSGLESPSLRTYVPDAASGAVRFHHSCHFWWIATNAQDRRFNRLTSRLTSRVDYRTVSIPDSQQFKLLGSC